MGGMFAGIMGGYTGAAEEQNRKLMEIEIDARKGIMEMYQTVLENPNLPQEMQQKLMEFMIQIPQLPLDKKMPKQFTDWSPGGELMKVRQQIRPPALPAPGNIPAQEGDLPPPTGEPRSFERTPGERRLFETEEAEAQTATDLNILDLYRRRGILPQGVTKDVPPRPATIRPDEALVPFDVQGHLQPERALYGPTSGAEVPTPGSFEEAVIQKRQIDEAELGRPQTTEEKRQSTLAVREDWISTDPNLVAIREMQRDRLQREGEAVLTPAQFNMAAKMSDQYFNASGEFLTVRDYYDRIQIGGEGTSPVSDLVLIFSFMKVLDPTSVVREGEFANAEDTRNIPDSVRSLYNRVIGGFRLSDEQRKNFVNDATRVFSSAKRQQNQLMLTYRNRAQGMKIPPEFVVIDFMAASALSPPSGSSSGGGPRTFSDEDFR